MIHVLIVEDDPMVAELNRMYVERVEGFSWRKTVSNVEEASAVLLGNKLDIHLVLLDIYMQKGNGLDLLPVIREIGENIDVIVISAASDMHTVKKALHYGAVDYLIKPFQFSRFHEALTAYRENLDLQEGKQHWSQSELDSLIRRKNSPTDKNKLPKGLTRQTFQGVWEWILSRNSLPFSTEDAAQVVGISRVSCRKYLMFLAELGALEADITYGTIGRPVNIYMALPAGADLVEPFLL